MSSPFRQPSRGAGERPRRASERFRRGSGRRLAVGLVVSVGVHVAIFGLLSRGGRGPSPIEEAALRLVVLPPVESAETARPPALVLPPPAPPIPRPAEPIPAAAPGADPPDWTPYDVPPRLLNPGEVRALLEDRSPAPEGEGERVVVLWMYVERSGEVTKLRLRRSSGLEDVDAAARDVTGSMRFRPALFRGRTVAVWIAQPIRFTFRMAGG